MIDTAEQRHAALALRLLLDQGSPPRGTTIDWRLLLALAQRNTVLVRLAARLDQAGLEPPAFFTTAVERERERARKACTVMRLVGAQCARAGIEHLFPTVWQHFPDLGGDLDLLVLSREPGVDAIMLAGTAAVLRARDLRDRLAGTALYWLRESGLALDVHHGRLGLVGEHDSYPARLVHRRRRHVHAGEEFFAPAPEDQLVLQGMTRLAGRRSFGLADVVATVTTVRGQPLDWSYVVNVSRDLGLLPGLGCYLGYVNQIHEGLYDRPLLPPDARHGLTLDGWGSVTFRAGRYCFPTLRTRNRLYWRQLAAAAGAGEWRVASRLCLLPAMVVASSLRLVGREAVEAMP